MTRSTSLLITFFTYASMPFRTCGLEIKFDGATFTRAHFDFVEWCHAIEKACNKKMVELRTGAVWEVLYINWKAIPGCWTKHRKGTGLHCSRAGEWDHQITVNRGSQCVYDGLHKKRECGIALTDRRTSTATPRTRSCMRCTVGMEAAYIGICG